MCQKCYDNLVADLNSKVQGSNPTHRDLATAALKIVAQLDGDTVPASCDFYTHEGTTILGMRWSKLSQEALLSFSFSEESIKSGSMTVILLIEKDNKIMVSKPPIDAKVPDDVIALMKAINEELLEEIQSLDLMSPPSNQLLH